jgi:phenylacetate-CoA ligase
MYTNLSKFIIYPLGDIVLGTDIVRYVIQLEESQWWSERHIRDYQEEKLNKLLDHAYKNVPYYREKFDEHGLKPSHITSKCDLEKIPILSKSDIKNSFPGKIVANNINRKQLLPGMTGGSTGQPIQFFRYKPSTSLDWAATIRAWGWAGYQMGEKYATLWGHPLTVETQSRLLYKFQNFMMRNLFLSAYELDNDTIKEYINRIEKYQPKFIRSYVSSACLLAQYIELHRISTIRPKAFFTTGEALYDHQRLLIEQQFECKIFDNYGSGEIHAIASECEQHSGLHISSENVIVECIKSDGSLAKPGEVGELVITDLNNYACPFIRYNIEDLGVLSKETCKCGRGLSKISSVEGRSLDVIILPNGRIVPPVYWTGLFKTRAGVDQYQIIQENPTNLILKIVKNPLFTNEDINHITLNLKKLGGEKLNYDIQIVDEIPVTGSGKLRFVITKVDNTKALINQ